MDKDFFLATKASARRKKQGLIERACEKILSLDIFSLDGLNMRRSRFQYEIFNQYPPHNLLDAFEGSQIVSHYAGNKEPFALYIHLPFCMRKCTFCCFRSTTEWSISDIDEYLSYLEKEVSLLLKNEYIRGREVSSLYWGGGTPTVLSCVQVDKLMGMLRNNFSIIPAAELIFEATPESLTPDKVECFLRNGFNRLSIGIQTFNNDLLKAYNRVFTRQEAIENFMSCQSAGFSHINIDFMHGLAGQTIDTYLDTLEVAAELRPANVTYYLFSDSTRRSRMSRYPSGRFPSEEERVLMHVMSMEHFLEAGYIQITPYQFITSWKHPYAHQEHKARNGEIHALGITGHSFFNNCDYHNHRSIENYKRALDNNQLPVKKGRYLNKKEQMIRFIVYGLQKTSGLNREDGGVNRAIFKERFGISIEDAFKDTLEELEKLGLILNSADYLRLSYKGLLYSAETSLFFYLTKDREKIVS